MDFTIRIATVSDLEPINQIIYDAYHHYIPRIGTTPGPMLDDYAPMIASNNLYVAENPNGDILGLVAVRPMEDHMVLSNLAVAPRAQGVGLGRKLMEFAEKLAVDTGYTTMKLYTNEAMTENIDIYGRKGYVETHRGVERGLKRVYMSKTLPSKGAEIATGQHQ
jgi:GNAT superfamily N-acetyltransferase